MSQRTHCPAGHEYDEENTYHYSGQRHCKTCRDARSAAYDRRRAPGSKSSLTPEGQAELVELRAQGVAYSQLAERYDISQATACTIFKALATPEQDARAKKNSRANLGAKKKISDADRAELIRLRNTEGLAYHVLAERFGISKSLACSICKAA
jgi:transposase-like protein